MRPLLKIEEAAEILGISLARCYQLARDGRLPVVRLGRQVRIAPQQLEQFISTGGSGLDHDQVALSDLYRT